MKYFSFLICAVIFSVCLNGCADNQAKFNALSKMQKKKKTYAESQTAEIAELARQPVRTTVESRREQTRMEKDNSVVETMYDAFGNKTESRVFYKDSLLKMVVLQTSADGQQQALIYGQNGEVKTAPPLMLDKVLTSVAGEIAKTVEIFEGRRENEMLAKLQTAQTPPTEDFPAVNFNSPTVVETVPVTENEQIAAMVESSTELLQPNKDELKIIRTEDSTLKLRAEVQSLKAIRGNSTAKKIN